MSILVIGGGGYVGSHLSNYLIDKGFLVTVYDNFWFGNKLKKIYHKKLREIRVSELEIWVSKI